MDYILLMLAAVLLIPVVFFVIREPSSAHADHPPSDKGITPLEPAADQPVPDGAEHQFIGSGLKRASGVGAANQHFSNGPMIP